MEETLGKRISANRKRLGITQDRLAEQLGVTAQAVSKWENDQSCPDITMLPRLADIFGVSVDSLLGVAPREPEKVVEAEVITEETKDAETPGNNWELHLDTGRNGHIGFAVWVLLMGSLMLFNLLTDRQVSLWDLAWPSALLIFGLGGLYPNFSFFRRGCGLFGIYSLLENLEFTFLGLSSQLLLPIAVILFGLSLLVDALRKPHKPHFSITHNGNSPKQPATGNVSDFSLGDDSFVCSTSLNDNRHLIDLPRLRSGEASVSFGQLTVDLTAVEEFAPDCSIEADCSCGDLTVLIPTRVRADVDSSSAFGSIDIRGNHDSNADAVIHIDANASFGQITIQYI